MILQQYISDTSNLFTIEYRFGFNGKEKTDEISGVGNHLDFKYRGYDPRTGRFWSVDSLFKDYPWNSTYCFAENDVIRSKDLEGAEKYIVTTMIHPNGIKITTTTENDVTGMLGKGTLYRLIDCPKGALSADYTENGKSYTVPFNYAFPEFNLKAPSEGKIKQGYTRKEKTTQTLKKIWKTINEDGGGSGDPSFGGNDITKKDVRSLASGLESAGSAVNLIGTGVGVFLPNVEGGIIGVGGILSGSGTGINAAVDLYEGNTTNATIRVVSFGINYGINNKISNNPNLSVSEKVIDQGAVNEVTGNATDNILKTDNKK